MKIVSAIAPAKAGCWRRNRRARALVGVLAATAIAGIAMVWSRSIGNAGAADTKPSSSPSPTTTATHEKATLGFAASQPVRDGEDSTASIKQAATATAQAVARPKVLRLTGALAPDEKSEVAGNVSGVVLEVCVDRGSIVKKGDVLVRLDPTDSANELAEGKAEAEELRVRLGLDQAKDGWKVEDQPEVQAAKSALDLAEANHRRMKDLTEKNAISKAEYDKARSEFDSAGEHYRQAIQQARQLYQSYQTSVTKLGALRKAVEDTVVKAPFNGWVAEKYVSPGERVTVGPGGGGKIALLLRIDPIRLSLTVPQQNLGVIKVGQKVEFRVDGLPDRVFTATTRYISPAVDNATRSLTVEATAANPDHLLRPGLFATAELQLDEQAKEMSVPSSSLQREGDVARLFVVREGVAREVVVSAGETVEGRTQILSGIEPADRIVLMPDKVKDGDRIEAR